MPQFMAYDQNTAQALTDRLAKTMFRSPSDFVNFYNSGLINKSHDDVAEMVRLLTSTFKNVKEQNKKLVFISSEEIQLKELFSSLEMWDSLTKIKREVARLLDQGVLTDQNTLLSFREDSPGYIFVEVDGELQKASPERMYSKHDDILEIYEKYSSFSDEGVEGICRFRAHEFLNLDTSFIEKMHAMLP